MKGSGSIGLLRAVCLGTALCLLATACGFQLGNSGSSQGGENEGPAAVSSRDAVESATVKIETDGVQTDPQYGTPEQVEGGGTGFVMDPSGLVVTNNHVVTGAAALDVYVGGADEPVNAEVLGVSECSDLAVLKLDEGELPYLGWRKKEISAGLDVYAMGYPFGEPFTVTRGIVSKAEADGETVWASVEAVIEHDATINPGNSGGPLVDGRGKLVGINYASDPNNRYYAIGREEAQKVIDRLKEGEDVDSLGINGQAFVQDESGDGVVDEGEAVEASGIYVYSVETGSPAGEAGLKGGDVLATLEGVSLAEDGTMLDYCKILRTNPEEPLKAEVLRLETGEILEGEINGAPLEVVETAPPPDDGGDTSGATTVVSDDAGVVAMEVPAEWTDVDGASQDFSGVTADATVTASADVAAWREGYEEPGASIIASRELAAQYTPEELLDANDFSSGCQDTAREPYDDGSFAGFVDAYTGCGESGNELVMVAATPPGGEYMLVLLIQTPPDAAGNEARDRIIQSFTVDEAALPGG
jgi:serine protease Do